ncbi:MAG: hypothetical protein ACLQFR_21355 [Streptosporangiaceae bacterium]
MRRPPAASREPFGVVDQVCCYFDTLTEPANVHLEVCLAGRLDHEAFRAAAAAAVTAHPRVSSRRAASNALSRNYSWERPASIDADPVSFTTFNNEAELTAKRNAFLARSPSIDRSPPVSILVASGPDGDYVILNAHHALMDGVSSVQLLRDVGRHYRGEAASQRAASRSTSTAVPDGPAKPAAIAGQEPWPASRRAQILAASRPARIASERGGQRGCGVYLLPLRDVPVVPVSPDLQVSVNDVLVAATVMAVGRWNAGHRKPARVIRITMPINARPAEQSQAIGNLSRIVPITARPPGAAADAAALLTDIARQARNAKSTPGAQVGLATRGIAAAWCPATVKRWLVHTARRLVGPFVCDTAMLSNLGDVPDPPDFCVPGSITMAFSAPAQMPRGLSVGVVTAGKRMQIAIRYSRALLDDAAAARLGSSIAQALEELTGPAEGASSGPASSGQPGSGDANDRVDGMRRDNASSAQV